MDAQIQVIADTAGGFLLNPYLFSMAVVVALALFTGFAGHVAIFMEDLQYNRTLRPASRPGSDLHLAVLIATTELQLPTPRLVQSRCRRRAA